MFTTAAAARFASRGVAINTTTITINSLKRRLLATASAADDAPVDLTYKPVYTPPFQLKTGWSPRPDNADALVQQMPFRVLRTKTGNSLPVYTDYRNARTRQLTLVRKVSGDLQVKDENK
jgi:hypothetical protein